ncbi:MAG TPA: serine/threonine-protein kinase, partial [Methylomirabilota bacterium]|nr:serine/threonine-protein kinase [Methylomirabilota bacterium]
MTPRVLATGSVLDGFTLTERIAVGGMSAIWRVRHPAHTEPLVMKLPFLGGGLDVSTVVAYETEEMILRRLGGPHVPRFIGAGDLSTRPYIVMEEVSGVLLEAMVTGDPMPAGEVARIGALVAAALDDLHGRSVVHHDIKAANVILAPRGAVLIDFGIARHAELPDLLAEETDEPMGSPSTIAPEQLLGERGNPQSDIFALGCVLYELATGRAPFGDPVSTAGQRRRLFRAPPPPRAVNRSVPRWLQEVILRCLEVDPVDRYPTAGHLLFDLRHPDQAPLTARADRTGNETTLAARLGAWVTGRTAPPAPRPAAPHRRQPSAPVVVAAVDLTQGEDGIAEEIRGHVARILSLEPAARLACVAVLRLKLVGENDRRDAAGRTEYVSRLVSLKDWARPLDLPETVVSFHVLEAIDIGGAIL